MKFRGLWVGSRTDAPYGYYQIANVPEAVEYAVTHQEELQVVSVGHTVIMDTYADGCPTLVRMFNDRDIRIPIHIHTKNNSRAIALRKHMKAHNLTEQCELLSYYDLIKQERIKLDDEIKQEQDRLELKQRDLIRVKLDSITPEQRQFLLSLMKHGRTSCSDENPTNGYSTTQDSWRCDKCMFLEILNGYHGTDYDFTITVDIKKVEPIS